MAADRKRLRRQQADARPNSERVFRSGLGASTVPYWWFEMRKGIDESLREF
jgi:hypothetical protein